MKRKKNASTQTSEVAVAVPAAGAVGRALKSRRASLSGTESREMDIQPATIAIENGPSPAAGTAEATTEAITTEAATSEPKPISKASAAMRERWRKIRAGEHPAPTLSSKRRPRSGNPLIGLPDEQRAKLFSWLRECPYDDAVLNMLLEQGVEGATREQLNDFFHFEAEQHWEQRIGRAAEEANALVRLVERSPVKFSAGILAALGQEAFRQIASGQVEPAAMGKLAELFLKARSDERADQMQELKREKLRHELQDQVDHALEKLSEEVDKNPAAKAAFDALRRELAGEGAEFLTE